MEESFGISLHFVFENNQTLYEERIRKFAESEISDIENSVKEYTQELKERMKSRPPVTAESSGPAPWQGDGNGGAGGGGSQGSKGGWKRKEKELPAEGNRIMGRNILAVKQRSCVKSCRSWEQWFWKAFFSA